MRMRLPVSPHTILHISCVDKVACVTTYHPASIIVCVRGCQCCYLPSSIYHCVWTRLSVLPLTTLHLSLCVYEAAFTLHLSYEDEAACITTYHPASIMCGRGCLYHHLPPNIYHCVWTRLPVSPHTTLYLSLCVDEAACFVTYHPASIIVCPRGCLCHYLPPCIYPR